MSISRIGFGCAGIGGYDYGPVDDSISIRAIHRALDLGLDFFDVADVYGLGHAEEVLGKALARTREQTKVATKGGVRWNARGETRRDCSPEWLAEAVDGSLRRLRLERIPLYQIHWPDPAVPIEETLGALVRLQECGKIEYIGCCNFSSDQVDAACRHAELVSLQVPFNLAEGQYAQTIDYCVRRYGMTVLTYNSLAQGFFSGKFTRESALEVDDLRSRSGLFAAEKLDENFAILERLKIVGGRHRRTTAQVAVRWILDRCPRNCALTGAKTPEQIEQNWGALGWRLSPEEMDFLGS